jgi:CRP-like cAMP-binding protein
VYAHGQPIVKQGETGACMYVVQAGEVEVVQAGARGERILAVLGPGEFFGEMAIFEKEVRSATVRARGEARVMTVDNKTLLRRIHEDPLLAVNLLRTLSKRLRDLNATVGQMEASSS